MSIFLTGLCYIDNGTFYRNLDPKIGISDLENLHFDMSHPLSIVWIFWVKNLSKTQNLRSRIEILKWSLVDYQSTLTSTLEARNYETRYFDTSQHEFFEWRVWVKLKIWGTKLKFQNYLCLDISRLLVLLLKSILEASNHENQYFNISHHQFFEWGIWVKLKIWGAKLKFQNNLLLGINQLLFLLLKPIREVSDPENQYFDTSHH